MNTSLSPVIALAALLLLGCSTAQPPVEQPVQAPPVAQLGPLPAVPPNALERDLPLEPPGPVVGRVCKLGDSCLDLDPRPFEVCLVGTKHCVDKALEPIPVQVPKDSGAAQDGPIPVGQR